MDSAPMNLRSRLLEVAQRLPTLSWLEEFLSWWGSGLVASLPRPITRWLSARQDRIVLELRPRGRRLLVERGPSTTPEIRYSHLLADDTCVSIGPMVEAMGRIPTRCRLLLRPSDDLLFERSLWLPLAARDHLRAVLDFEIPRQTPFRTDDISYHAEVVEEDRDGRRVRVQLSLIPRSYLGDALGLLAELGETHFEIETPSLFAQRWEVRPPQAMTKRRIPKLRTRDLALALFVLLPALALAFVPPWLASATLKENRSTLEALRGQLAATSEEHARIAVALTRRSYVEAQTRQIVPITQIMAALTTTFAGQVHLRQLEYSDQGLTLRGTTLEPSRLAGQLDASPLFSNVAFQSTAQAATAGENEFALQMQVGR